MRATTAAAPVIAAIRLFLKNRGMPTAAAEELGSNPGDWHRKGLLFLRAFGLPSDRPRVLGVRRRRAPEIKKNRRSLAG